MRKPHTNGRSVETSDLMVDDMHYELVDNGRNARGGQWRALWRSIRAAY